MPGPGWVDIAHRSSSRHYLDGQAQIGLSSLQRCSMWKLDAGRRRYIMLRRERRRKQLELRGELWWELGLELTLELTLELWGSHG